MPSGEGSAAYGCCGPGDDGPAPGMHLGSGAGGSADDLDVFRLGPLLALGDVELDPLPLLQAAVAAAGDRAEVHEDVLATLDSDEAIAPVAVEPLHSALRHLDLLNGEAAPPRHGMPGPRLPDRLRLACHGTRRMGQPCGWPAARRPGPDISRGTCHYGRGERVAAMQGSRAAASSSRPKTRASSPGRCTPQSSPSNHKITGISAAPVCTASAAAPPIMRAFSPKRG